MIIKIKIPVEHSVGLIVMEVTTKIITKSKPERLLFNEFERTSVRKFQYILKGIKPEVEKDIEKIIKKYLQKAGEGK